MKVLYCRISSADGSQKSDRQRTLESEFDLVIEDQISGLVPFFQRPGGIEIKKLIDHQLLKSLFIHSIDRCGRDMLDIMNTIHYFTQIKIPITFISQGLITLNDDGSPNPISTLMINVLSSISNIELTNIRERQREGIRIAKLKGIYKGRAKGSSEDVLTFLGKDKNRKALELLKKNYKAVEISKILDININTITKIKKLGLSSAC